MYVIYPAEEIISLTYGVAAAVQRPVIQRPTLDNLREPLVPVGTRTPSPASVPSLSPQNSAKSNIQRQSNKNNNTLNPNVFINDQDVTSTFDASDFDETLTLNNFNGNPVNYYTPPSSPSLDPVTSATTKPPQPPLTKQGKPKSKLQLKFAKLGRPHSNPEPAESTRVLEYHDIRVSNPTFTRDNLRQRNFDAFFEAGESVYSIETKEKTSSPSTTEPSPIFDDASFVTQQPPKPPKSKLNFLKRNKTPSKQQQQQQQPTSNSRRGSRSSDILLIVEEPQKGDRCTPLMILIALVL